MRKTLTLNHISRLLSPTLIDFKKLDNKDHTFLKQYKLEVDNTLIYFSQAYRSINALELDSSLCLLIWFSDVSKPKFGKQVQIYRREHAYLVMLTPTFF